MILMSLVALLDAASEAHRPVAEQLVWHADHQPGADRLLGQVVGAMLETGLACFASTEDGIAPDELPAGRWQMLGPGHWRVWSLKDPHRWCESYLHTLGNYAIPGRRSSEAAVVEPAMVGSGLDASRARSW